MDEQTTTTVPLPPSKKRGLDLVLQDNSSLLCQNGDDDGDRHIHPFPRRRQADMRGILERYHALALSHHAQTKRRRLESTARAAEARHRLEQIAAAVSMAQDTLHVCTRLLRGEESERREHHQEQRVAEEELRKAEEEKALAEGFLKQFGGDGGRVSHPPPRPPPAMHRIEERMDHGKHANEREPPLGTVQTIGGIPAKFLDLSCFPELRKSFHEGSETRHDLSSPDSRAEGTRLSRPLIDCTGEIGRGIPEEVSLRHTPSKRIARRVYITGASLSHTNGTYVQEGRHGGAPLFVRTGTPHKFMGKWDCDVVLRREGEGMATVMAVWKIGLVPARRVDHPRLIGYYAAADGLAGRAEHVDRMEEDEEASSDGGGDDLEPPAGGWRVLQGVSGGKDNSTGLGRACGLHVSYEE